MLENESDKVQQDMSDIQTPQPDYNAIARQAYEWLKKRRETVEISTFEVLMEINGYKWGSKELEQLERLDLFDVHYRLLRLIRKEKEYVADSPYKEEMYMGLPYHIPFIFREK